MPVRAAAEVLARTVEHVDGTLAGHGRAAAEAGHPIRMSLNPSPLKSPAELTAKPVWAPPVAR